MDEKYIWSPEGPQLVQGYPARLQGKTSMLLVHHAGGGVDKDETRSEIDALHRSKGWKGIGYNGLIRKDGTIYNGRGADALGSHAGKNTGNNSKSVGVCLTGNLDKEFPTKRQWESLVTYLSFCCKRYNLNPHKAIKGHRDSTATDCPGDVMYDLLPQLRIDVAARMAKSNNAVDELLDDLSNDSPNNSKLSESEKGAIHGAWVTFYSFFDKYPADVREAMNKLRHHAFFD